MYIVCIFATRREFLRFSLYCCLHTNVLPRFNLSTRYSATRRRERQSVGLRFNDSAYNCAYDFNQTDLIAKYRGSYMREVLFK